MTPFLTTKNMTSVYDGHPVIHGDIKMLLSFIFFPLHSFLDDPTMALKPPSVSMLS